MKKFIFLLAVLGSTQVFASKARLRALNSSFQIQDTQSEFTSPYHLFSVKDFVSVESGSTAATGADDGDEALVKTSINEDSKILVAFGHKDESIQGPRKFLNTAAATIFTTQQNPVEVIYSAKVGDTIWGAGAFYSKFKDKVASNSESSSGLRLAASHGDFKWKINSALENKVENVTDGTFKAEPYVNVGLRYNSGDDRFAVDGTVWNAKHTNLTGVEVDSHEYQNYKFQYVRSLTKEGDIFYGVAVDSIALKNKLNDKKLSRLAVPLWFAFEAQASDWLILRASIKQTIWTQSKDENGYVAGSIDGAFGVADSDYAGEPNNTEVATGLGLKFQQFVLDGTLKAMTGKTQTQQINSANFLALVAITYQL